jgi:hypothetical protein
MPLFLSAQAESSFGNDALPSAVVGSGDTDEVILMAQNSYQVSIVCVNQNGGTTKLTETVTAADETRAQGEALAKAQRRYPNNKCQVEKVTKR